MNRRLVRLEYEKSPLNTIVYGGTGTGETYFVRQYLKLYQQSCFAELDLDLDQDQIQAKKYTHSM